jgi:putative glutamine amidotransferase
MVNSLHEQAIDRIADRLEIEAISDDGVIEATSVKGAESFALSVQWHPEHPLALEWPLSRAMFAAFGEACRQRQASRGGTVRRGGRGRNHAA